MLAANGALQSKLTKVGSADDATLNLAVRAIGRWKGIWDGKYPFRMTISPPRSGRYKIFYEYTREANSVQFHPSGFDALLWEFALIPFGGFKSVGFRYSLLPVVGKSDQLRVSGSHIDTVKINGRRIPRGFEFYLVRVDAESGE